MEETTQEQRGGHPVLGVKEDANPPPTYRTAAPPLSLSLFLNSQPFAPQILQMSGESRSPDFHISTSTTPPAPLFQVKTDSTLISHETVVRSVQQNFNMFTMKRKGSSDGPYMYSAHAGRSDGQGVKILEVETRPKMLAPEGSRTRMVFRNAGTGELDEVFLAVSPRSSGDSAHTIVYRDEKIGSVRNVGNRRTPSYTLDILVPGMDPLLFVVLALVVDDRSMTSRRRLRRSATSGWTGIGKGPGAGLAGAYALGGM